ncbi:hypothetical protein TPAR_00110 [Tolypocladium paradoxum]|uniref:Uncharacterized protein n=1 Tax=Tolypocladium paradoxum TaxID=94208 RepID=A0A2S4LBB2_9HYPO|nr:hypothetical protein TPAR_00110 [Tolypocladium paradoxum]
MGAMKDHGGSRCVSSVHIAHSARNRDHGDIHWMVTTMSSVTVSNLSSCLGIILQQQPSHSTSRDVLPETFKSPSAPSSRPGWPRWRIR